jgi:hypothetical protein
LALLGHQLMASARPPKKSETIEIRVDYGTKSALARTESRSVSDVLRDLIARYLADAPSVSPTGSTIMRFSIAAAAAAALTLSIVALTTPATAADLTLGLRGMIDTGGAPPPFERPESSVSLDFGQTAVFCLPADARSPVTLALREGQTCQGGYGVLIWAEAGDAENVVIGMRLLQAGEAVERHGALIPVTYGSPNEMMTFVNGMPGAVRVMFFAERAPS